jgi:hypothetical protein
MTLALCVEERGTNEIRRNVITAQLVSRSRI